MNNFYCYIYTFSSFFLRFVPPMYVVIRFPKSSMTNLLFNNLVAETISNVPRSMSYKVVIHQYKIIRRQQNTISIKNFVLILYNNQNQLMNHIKISPTTHKDSSPNHDFAYCLTMSFNFVGLVIRITLLHLYLNITSIVY